MRVMEEDVTPQRTRLAGALVSIREVPTARLEAELERRRAAKVEVADGRTESLDTAEASFIEESGHDG